MNKLKNTAIIL